MYSTASPSLNSTSSYLDDLLNIGKYNFRKTYEIIMILKPPALYLDLSTTNGIVSSIIYDKRDHFNFEIVNFLFLNGLFLAPFLMVYLFHSLYSFCESVLYLW